MRTFCSRSIVCGLRRSILVPSPFDTSQNTRLDCTIAKSLKNHQHARSLISRVEVQYPSNDQHSIGCTQRRVVSQANIKTYQKTKQKDGSSQRREYNQPTAPVVIILNISRRCSHVAKPEVTKSRALPADSRRENVHLLYPIPNPDVVLYKRLKTSNPKQLADSLRVQIGGIAGPRWLLSHQS